MDTSTGEVRSLGSWPKKKRSILEIEFDRLSQRCQEELVKDGVTIVDVYDPCPCGSGKKFKWCCYRKDTGQRGE